MQKLCVKLKEDYFVIFGEIQLHAVPLFQACATEQDDLAI